MARRVKAKKAAKLKSKAAVRRAKPTVKVRARKTVGRTQVGKRAARKPIKKAAKAKKTTRRTTNRHPKELAPGPASIVQSPGAPSKSAEELPGTPASAPEKPVPDTD